LPQRIKKKKLNMQFIIFIYKECRSILLSGLKIETLSKMRKWVCRMSVVNWLEILCDFRQWRILKWRNLERLQLFLYSQERMHVSFLRNKWRGKVW
jgi:hypothetical protein